MRNATQRTPRGPVARRPVGRAMPVNEPTSPAVCSLLESLYQSFPADSENKGDERPCNRCIKRGLAEHCHDGVRKKAKYLHDAPNEALLPGPTGPFGQQTSTPISAAAQPSPADMQTMTQPSSYYSNQTPAPTFPAFSQTPASGPVNSPSTQDSPIVGQYGNQQSTMLSSTYQGGSGQQLGPNQDSMTGMNRSSPQDPKQGQPFATPMFDPSDPSIFNFDITSFNFGNHYGAMEFGMLGQMSSGAVDTPDVDSNMMNSKNQHQSNNTTFDSGNNGYPTPSTSFPYNNPYSADWSTNTTAGSQQNNTNQMYSQIAGTDAANGFDSNFPNAFAIAEGNGSISSASPSGFVDFNTGYVSSPAATTTSAFPAQNQSYSRSQNQPNRQQSKGFMSSTDNGSRKKRREPSEVYYSVTAPYSYTTGFHCLIAFVSKRFNPQKTLRIAKALASIRPSFISCSNKLTNDDLIFMEKLFQRTLYEYETYMHALGTPTVLFRRTGEVASASKEFSLLSGWRKDVLLGIESNLNVNTGGTSGVLTGTSTRGTATPRMPESGTTNSAERPQPVFLAELIDEDSVIGFYEDFAKHAFGDARGTVSRRCKLLKYRTNEDPGWGNRHTFGSSDALPFGDAEVKVNPATGNPLIMGEDGINALGVRDGKVDCMLSWTIKRDPFDVPMLIIINVSHAYLKPW